MFIFTLKSFKVCLCWVFSFILCDSRLTNDDSKIYIARDPYGVRPLYQLKPISTNSKIYGFSSEIKMLYDIYHNP